MTQKIVISKSGYNALTESDTNNLTYSSDYDTLKYHSSGTLDIEVPGSDIEEEITHNLGYIPFFIVYMNYSPGASDYSFVPAYSYAFGTYSTVNAYATSSKIYFTVKTNSAFYTPTITFYYKIFRNNTGL